MQKINHVVVLMLENRSFDHMLGFLRSASYRIDGLTGSESNPVDPHIAASPQIKVSPAGGSIPSPDPGHNFADVNVQLFANPSGPPPVGPPNRGFVFSYAQQPHVTPAIAQTIMQCFPPDKLPVLTRLAQEFAVCDRWFSSVPGPTWPNRFFAHCATSKGFLDNGAFHDYDMSTIFEQLGDKGFSWRIYFHDVAQSLALRRLSTADQVVNFVYYWQFARDAKKGTLPNYSFIEPRFFTSKANDQHPPHDLALGEALIADVYNVLRSSSAWKETLLLIVYDEHGGTYDHVTPPAAVPPDGNTGQFAFDRYGLRVPAVVVSPFIAKGTIVHDTVFDHASIPATVREVFGIEGALTARDKAATTFAKIAGLAQARTDTPAKLGVAAQAVITAAAAKLPSKRAAGAAKRPRKKPVVPVQGQVSDSQRSLIDLAHSLVAGAPANTVASGSLAVAEKAVPPMTSEQAAGKYVEQATKGYLVRAKAQAPAAAVKPPAKATR
jgi:phospholipase C